jgi:hypothetical protein
MGTMAILAFFDKTMPKPGMSIKDERNLHWKITGITFTNPKNFDSSSAEFSGVENVYHCLLKGVGHVEKVAVGDLLEVNIQAE